jgi:Flp pilus assembly pilin Flp
MKRIKALLTTFGVLSMMFLPIAVGAQVAVHAQADIKSGLCAGANFDPNDANCDVSNTEAKNKVASLVQTIINVISWIVGVVSVVMIIWGGFKYITSSGNDSAVTSAKNTILYAIIGLVIVALAQVIVRFVLAQFDNTNS